MSVTGAESIRHRGGWLIPARWWLIVTMLLGVFCMHVLGSHDGYDAHGQMIPGPGGGHAMAPAASPAASPAVAPTMHSAPIDASLSAGDVRPAILSPDRWFTAGPSGPADDMSGSMLACVLFLVAASGLIVLGLLLTRRTGDPDRASSRSGSLFDRRRRRGPPGPGAPRISLCVLRV